MENERKGLDGRGEGREREWMMKKNGREKDRKGKEEKEGHGKNNSVEIVPYSLHFFHDFSPPSHHFPSFFSSPYPFLLPFLLLSHHLSSSTLFVITFTHSLIISSSYPLSSPLLTSPPSHITPFSHHPLLTSPPSHITSFSLSTLFYYPPLSFHPLLSPPPISFPPPFFPSSFNQEIV